MTFKGMLKILVNDYKKQHEEKMFTIANELIKTRRELCEVKEQLRTLQLGCTPPLSSSSETLPIPTSTISLFVQYNGFFNELCHIRQTMTIKELLIKLRQITGIPIEHPIRIRVLSEDGLDTLFFFDKELNRTLESYDEKLKARMILSIEDAATDDEQDNNDKKTHLQRSKSITNSERTHSYESDV